VPAASANGPARATDRDRRDFICVGSGAGMAAALGAPVGGVLFALEETSSHLSALLIWRTFAAALAATLVLAFLKVPRPAARLAEHLEL
jgi:H+/Cl- antiporter ClcA